MLEAEHVGFGASGRNGGWVSALWPVGADTLDRRYGRTRHPGPARRAARHRRRGGPGRRRGGPRRRLRQGRGAGRGPHAGPGGAGPGRRRARGVVGRRHGLAGCRRHPRAARRRRVARCDLHPALRPGAPAPARRRPGRRRPPARRPHRRGRPRGAASATGSSCSPTATGSRPPTSWSPPRAGRARLPGLSRRVAPVYSLMVATEPIDDERWARIGLAGPRGVRRPRPRRHLRAAHRRRPDRLRRPRRAVPLGLDDPARVRRGAHRLRRAAHDAARPAPPARRHRVHPRVGRPARHRPRLAPVGRPGTRRPASAAPVATSATASPRATWPAAPWPTWCCGRDTALTALPWVGHRSPRWEPEPLRWLGINAGLQLAAARRPRGGVDRSPGAARRRCSTGSPRTRFGSCARSRACRHCTPCSRTGGPLAGLRLQDLDLTGTRTPCSPAPTSRAWSCSAGASRRPSTRTCARTGPWSSRPTRGRRSTPTARRSTSRASCTPGWPSTATRRRPTPGLPLVARRRRPARRVRHPAAGDPRRLGHRRPRRVHRRGADRRRDGGHALARGTDALPGAALLGHRLADRGSRGRHRRRARARWRRPTSGPSHRTRRRSRMPCERLTAVPSFVPDIGAWADGRPGRARRRSLAGGGARDGARVQQHRHPDVVLRARAAQRVLRRHRQVLLQRAARGRPARPLDRRARRARGRGRHRAGDLPGGHAAVLLARGCRAAGRRARRARALDRGRCRCGRP